MQKILFVGMGGFIGCCLRYVVTLHSLKLFGIGFPYGTLIVNISGAILIGFILQMSVSSGTMSEELKLFLTTGMMGGLTTFSTFSNETVSLFTQGSYLLGALNASLNVFLSLLGVIAGRFLGRLVV
jgi:CrcB protein